MRCWIFPKFDAGAVEANPKDVSLQHLFEQLLTDNEPQAEEKGLVLVIKPTGAHRVVRSGIVIAHFGKLFNQCHTLHLIW
jgi:hypothetical protein